jgi:molecular chaperone DnaK (HSP70)
LVGGTSQIQVVQDWVRGYFEAEKVRCDRPFEAIAQGALQVAQGVEIADFLYHSYGIRYWNSRTQKQDWHRLINAGQAYPMREPVSLVLGASLNNQPSIELVLGELGAQSNATEIYFDGGRLLTRVVGASQGPVQALNDSDAGRSMAKLDPPGSPGMDRLKLLFWVDGDRFLRVTVEDLLTLETVVEDVVVVQLS